MRVRFPRKPGSEAGTGASQDGDRSCRRGSRTRKGSGSRSLLTPAGKIRRRRTLDTTETALTGPLLRPAGFQVPDVVNSGSPTTVLRLRISAPIWRPFLPWWWEYRSLWPGGELRSDPQWRALRQGQYRAAE